MILLLYTCIRIQSGPKYLILFNFNKFLSNLDVKDFLQDNTILLCDWVGSGIADKDHRHIVTGDLQNVGNNKLRKLFIKGPKYKETNSISQGKAKFTR